MNELEQFKGILASMDLGEKKDEILSTFDNVSTKVTGLIADLKTNLADEREKTQPLKDKNKEFLNALGLKENSTADEVKDYVKSLNNSSKLDELKQTLESKHESELNELRGLIQEKETALSESNTKYEDLQFRINVDDKGLLKDFIDNPIIKSTLTNDLKSKLIFENGQAFIKDENGNIQRDIQTGEPLPVESLIDSYKVNPIYKDFVVNPIKGNGSGVQESKGNIPKQGNKISDFTVAELRNMMKNDPQRYASLEKNK